MESFRVTINENGRIIIPAPIRKDMHIKAGDELTLTYNDSNLQIETRKQVIKRVQKFFMQRLPKDVSLVDELIQERREEARRENE